MKSEPDMLEVRQVCELTGATARQLRTWDERGLLQAQRTGEQVANNRKLFTADDVERVQDILLLRKLGLGLDDIRAILEAPDEERREHLARHAEELRLDYARIQSLISISNTAQILGIECARESALTLGSYEILARSYGKDENLHQFSRWLASHTERDITLFANDILEVASLFAEARQHSEWEQLEICIARFCDMWSKRFGWPSVGQMLALHLAFEGDSDHVRLIDETYGEGTSAFMAQAFLLAWISSALGVLDDILVHLYRGQHDEDNYAALQNAAEVFTATACEFMGYPHLTDAAASSRATERLSDIAESFFAVIVDFALDEEVNSFLSLEDFPAVDGPAMELAQAIAEAHIRGELEKWAQDEGFRTIRHRMQEWLDGAMTFWLLGRGENPRRLKDAAWLEDHYGEFEVWLEDWLDERYDDPPEAHWATEEESCVREKANREFLERQEEADDVKIR
ncbi:MAG: MerR family transcriptional regulator [Coriobacteriales bacterium]